MFVLLVITVGILISLEGMIMAESKDVHTSPDEMLDDHREVVENAIEADLSVVGLSSKSEDDDSDDNEEESKDEGDDEEKEGK